MDSDAPAVERLRMYLRELPPDAQAAALLELERAALRGEEIPGADALLTELRRGIQRSPRKPQRVGNPSRLFFHAIEPFIVDGAPVRRHRGYVARACLNPIWLWICRDLAPTDARTYTEAARRALLANDAAAAEKLAHAFQDRVVKYAEKILATADSMDHAHEQLVGYMGPPRVLDDLQEMICILRVRRALTQLASQLPARIEDLSGGRLAKVMGLLNPLAGARHNVFLYALILVLSRLDARWQLVRLAIDAAQSREAARIAKTPYNLAVALVLADIEDMADALRTRLKNRETKEAGDVLRAAHAAIHAVASELDMTQDTPLSRRCGVIRADVSGLLTAEIQAFNAGIKRLLERPPPRELLDSFALDETDLAEAEEAVALVNSIEGVADEFNVGNAIRQALSKLKMRMEETIASLFAAARKVGETLRKFYLAQLEAAARICAKLFGRRFTLSLVTKVGAAEHGERDGGAPT